MLNGGLAHTTTITWPQWVLLTPSCLPLDSGPGSSLLRQLAVGGGGLPNSSTANLTAPGPLLIQCSGDTFILYALWGDLLGLFSQRSRNKGHRWQEREILPQDSGGMHHYDNSIRNQGQCYAQVREVWETQLYFAIFFTFPQRSSYC